MQKVKKLSQTYKTFIPTQYHSSISPKKNTTYIQKVICGKKMKGYSFISINSAVIGVGM